MKKPYDGYMGKVLFVDLTNRTHSLYPWTDADRRRTLGGKVMAADILLRHIQFGMQAFDEDNWIVVTTGPLTGCGCPCLEKRTYHVLSSGTSFFISSVYFFRNSIFIYLLKYLFIN